MKTFIKKLLREGLEYGYFKDKTSVPDFDALKNGMYDELPPQFKNLEAKVEFMTKDEYLNACARIQETTYEQQLSFINKTKVQQYVEAMKNGAKFNMGYLDYANEKQEGRHRIVAAAELGQKNIPVLVIDNKYSSESLETKLGEWSDLKKDKNGDYLVSYNLGNYSDEKKLLVTFSKNYDIYYLDEILNDYVHTSITSKYDESDMERIGDNININDYDILSLFPKSFLDTLNIEDGEYVLTPKQETYIKFIIELSLIDKAKQNNSIFLSWLTFNNKEAMLIVPEDIKFENINEFDNAKDLLVKQNPYDLPFKTSDEVSLDKKYVESNIKKYPL